jgi:hypothetical protein
MKKIILTGLTAISLLTSCSKEECVVPQIIEQNTQCLTESQNVLMFVGGQSSYAVVTHSCDGELIQNHTPTFNGWEYSICKGDSFTVTSQEPNGNTTNPTIFVYVDSTLVHTHSIVDNTGNITYTYINK